MNSLEVDREFFAQVNSVVGLPRFVPGLLEAVSQWKAEDVGTPFYTRFDRSAYPYDMNVLVGVALPLDEGLTRHVVVLISGEKMIIEPKDLENLDRYVSFLAGDRSMDLQQTTDMSQIAIHAFDNQVLGSRVVMRNDTEANGDYINSLIPQAVGVAKQVRQRGADARSY